LPLSTSNFYEGLNFILKHFEEPLFPRTISSYATQGGQFEVYSKEEVVRAYEQSDFLDCRINAYPSYTEYKGINRQSPNFIFIDLDKSTFNTERAHRMALTATLKNIKEKLLGANPTVIWTGNGYHIYQSIDSFILEEEEVFSSRNFDQPTILVTAITKRPATKKLKAIQYRYEIPVLISMLGSQFY
jgi:hypothetical protein